MYEFLDWTVQDVMNRPVALTPDSTLADAEALFEEHGFNTLPVVDATGKLLGILSSLDLLRAFDFAEDEILPPFEEVMALRVSEVMVREVQTVCSRTPLSRVLRKIVDTRNKSFPVVDDEHVIGMVARQDLMLALRRGTRGEKPWAAGGS